jgi:hypothetical protein
MAKTKSKKNQKTSPLKALMQQTMKTTPAKKFVVNPQGEISMSDAISQILEPYRQDGLDFAAFKNLVMLACAAWNDCVVPIEKREAMIQDILALIHPDQQSRQDFLDIFQSLMDRKKKLFPHVSRIIVNYKATDIGNDYHIAIASTLEKAN